jgi:predicted type IV restriction endonuclease
MFTACTNSTCCQRYRIKPEMIGLIARCKKCNNVFTVEQAVEIPKPVDLEPSDEHQEEATSEAGAGAASEPNESEAEQSRKRRSPREVMQEHISRITKNVNTLIPKLNLAFKKQENESNTRLLINQMLQEVLGYNIDCIKTEQKIEGRKADYVLCVDETDVMVIEAKRIGMQLREGQIFQATSYGAYSGIKWAVLTNGMVWQLYHISTGEKIETDLIFTVDLMDGLNEEEAFYFYMLSRHGICRKNLLEDSWRKIRALSYDNIMGAILSDEVVTKIRKVLSKQTGYKLTDEELRNAIEENILQL